MRNYLILILLLNFLSCGDSALKSKHNVRYLSITEKINHYRPGIDVLLKQLPAKLGKDLEKTMNLVQNNDLDAFVGRTRMNEDNLVLFFESVENFTERIEQSRKFVPNESHRDVYRQVRKNITENRALVEPFIAKINNPDDPQELSLKLVLRKILKYERLSDFLADSVVTEEEYNVRMKEYNDKWSSLMIMIASDFLN